MVIIINYKLWDFILFSMQNIFKKIPTLRIKFILFLFCRPTNLVLFAVLPVDQKRNLVSPYIFYYFFVFLIKNDMEVLFDINFAITSK